MGQLTASWTWESSSANTVWVFTLITYWFQSRLSWFIVQDSAPREANLDSHNTQDQLFIPEDRATLRSTTPQPAVVVPLPPAVTTTSLDFSKYPDYVYDASHSWRILIHGYLPHSWMSALLRRCVSSVSSRAGPPTWKKLHGLINSIDRDPDLVDLKKKKNF